MNINIKATNMELTDAIRDYVNEKIGSLDKFIHDEGGGVQAWVEVGKTTKHHQHGNIFRTEAQIRMPHASLRAVTEKDNLYAAVDEVRDELKREIRKLKTKQVSRQRQGGRMLKKLLSVFYK